MLSLTRAVNHRVGQVTLTLQTIIYHHCGVFMFLCVFSIVSDFVPLEQNVEKKYTIKSSTTGISMSQDTFVHPGLSGGCHVLIVTLPKEDEGVKQTQQRWSFWF